MATLEPIIAAAAVEFRRKMDAAADSKVVIAGATYGAMRGRARMGPGVSTLLG
jgi:hypothetical protein